MRSLTRRKLWTLALSPALLVPAWAEDREGPKTPPKGYKLLPTGPFDFAKDFSEGLAAVKVNRKWGFIDTSGKMVIEPQFNPRQAQFNSYFSDGLVAINFNDGASSGMDGNEPRNIKWGFADKKGRIVINPAFDGDYYNPPRFSEGLAAVLVTSPEFYTGYIDKTGKLFIEAKFEKAHDFKNGLALARINDKWGMINKRGVFVVDPIYENLSDFSEGLAVATLEGKSFFIDNFGSRINNESYEYLSSLSDGLASFSTEGKTGFVDRSGKVVIKPQFIADIFFGIGSFSEGLCLIEFGNNGGSKIGDIFSGKFGYINKRGEIVINPRFGFSSSFSGGIAQVQFEGKSGYIDKAGNFLIPPQFTEAGEFHDGVALVRFNTYGKYFFIKKIPSISL